MAKGYLVVNVYNDTIANPIKNAKIKIYKDDVLLNEQLTNEDGQTNLISLDTVDKNFSLEDQHEIRPYETYELVVEALGLTPTKIDGVQIFDNITSIQNVYLTSIDENDSSENIIIPPNILWEPTSPNNITSTTENTNDETPYVLNKVIIPENIIVHDGIPSNTSASNYTVPFTDYIKNVASSEIYSTWPTETLKANILAIISFTLNRIFTEWYPSKGYNFTITSTTSYDQKYTRNGTIFLPISKIVDEIFDNYIRQGFRVEPLLAHYKSKTDEPGNLSQWGSKELGDKGYNYLEILKYYYGNNINIAEGTVTDEYPYTFTTNLKKDDCSKNVYILQNTLNYIRSSYPGIPVIENPSGYFNDATENTVKVFQKVFNLPQTDIVDYATWYKISYIFVAVSKMTNSIYQ